MAKKKRDAKGNHKGKAKLLSGRIGLRTGEVLVEADEAPTIDWLLANQAKVPHYFHQLAIDGQLE
jgi:hypothetical protein